MVCIGKKKCEGGLYFDLCGRPYIPCYSAQVPADIFAGSSKLLEQLNSEYKAVGEV